MQAKDTSISEKTSRTSVQNKAGKMFFTSPRVKGQSADKELPDFPFRNGKMILRVSSKSKSGSGSRSRQTAERSWLDDDDVFGFDAED